MPCRTKLTDVAEEGIDRYGSARFQNTTETATEMFLELLKFGLGLSVMAFQGEYFVQNKGVYIGACLAPVLSDLLLARCDKESAVSLADSRTVRVFRCMNDFLTTFQ